MFFFFGEFWFWIWDFLFVKGVFSVCGKMIIKYSWLYCVCDFLICSCIVIVLQCVWFFSCIFMFFYCFSLINRMYLQILFSIFYVINVIFNIVSFNYYLCFVVDK